MWLHSWELKAHSRQPGPSVYWLLYMPWDKLHETLPSPRGTWTLQINFELLPQCQYTSIQVMYWMLNNLRGIKNTLINCLIEVGNRLCYVLHYNRGMLVWRTHLGDLILCNRGLLTERPTWSRSQYMPRSRSCPGYHHPYWHHFCLIAVAWLLS